MSSFLHDYDVTGAAFATCRLQKYDAREATFENGIFLGPVANLTFKGPYLFEKVGQALGKHALDAGKD